MDIFADEVGLNLGNKSNSPAYKGLIRTHPYRFVFLNCCETANDDRWHNAFGIYRQIDHLDLAIHPGNAQAFVGWVNSPRMPLDSSDWYDIAVTYALLNQAWMDGLPLEDCLDLASREYPFSPTDQQTHLAWPLGKDFLPIYYQGNPLWPGNWSIAPNNHKLRIYGYAGLKRHGYDANPRHDSSWYYQDTR